MAPSKIYYCIVISYFYLASTHKHGGLYVCVCVSLYAFELSSISN